MLYRWMFWVIIWLSMAAMPILALAQAAGLPRMNPAPKPINIIDLPGKFGQEFVDTAVDYAAYWTVPFRWQEKEWGTFWTVVGITGAVILVDQPIWRNVDPGDFRSMNTALQSFHELGQWQHTAILLSSGYVGSYILQDPKLERASRIAIKSFLFQSMVNQGMKNLIYRTIIDDPYDFRVGPPKWQLPSSGAFPSGHASNMWAMMSGYALAYKDDPIIPWLCYGSATIGSALLVTNGDHWVSDIILGAALGYYSAEYMTYLDDKRARDRGEWVPVIEPNRVGVAMRIGF